MRVLGCATVLALMVTLASPAFGLDINCLQKYGRPDLVTPFKSSGRVPTLGSCKIATMNGPIAVGDADKFARLLRDHPFLVQVQLDSPGGSIEEAMKIGRLIRKHLIATKQVVGYSEECVFYSRCGPPPHCSSACFFIWSAGFIRSGERIGLHRPTSKELLGMDPDRASVWYRQILTELEAYLREMEVPPQFFQIMTSTTSSGIRWLSRSEIESMFEVPSIDEWLTAACGKKNYDCRESKLWLARDAIK